MALTNDQITAQNFKDFYGQIRPYLNGNFPTPIVNCFAKSDMHSTDEKIIGTASDGKPLYQKCFDIAAFNHPLSTGNSSRITLMASTGKKLINAFGYLWKSTGTTSVQIPSCAITSGVSPYIYYQATVDEVNDNFRLVYERNDTNQMSFDEGGYVVLQYTKTGDSAIKVGTGTDYSTDEQVVGTWIDGKPLCQRTYSFTLPVIYDGTENGCDVVTLENTIIISVDGYISGNNQTNYPLAFTTVSSGETRFVNCFKNGSGIVKIKTNLGTISEKSGYVTLRYVKTTD